jgi:hypothetical protein
MKIACIGLIVCLCLAVGQAQSYKQGNDNDKSGIVKNFWLYLAASNGKYIHTFNASIYKLKWAHNLRYLDEILRGQQQKTRITMLTTLTCIHAILVEQRNY